MLMRLILSPSSKGGALKEEEEKRVFEQIAPVFTGSIRAL